MLGVVLSSPSVPEPGSLDIDMFSWPLAFVMEPKRNVCSHCVRV